MTDAPTRTAALAAAVDDLTWCTTVPHRLGQIVGIYAETLAAQPLQFRHGASSTAILQALADHGIGGHAKGSHSDPTARAALAGQPGAIDDGDGTLRAIDSAIALIGESAHELDHDTATAAGKPTPTARTARSRDDLLADALARLHRIRYHLEDAIAARPDQAEHWDELLRLRVADTASWLRTKAEAIWVASKGERLPVVPDRAPDACRICGPWHASHAKPPTAIGGSNGRCTTCDNFHRNHGFDRTESIWKRAEYGQGPTPGQMLEAKAAAASKGSRKRRARAG